MTLFVYLLSVAILNATMLNVRAPYKYSAIDKTLASDIFLKMFDMYKHFGLFWLIMKKIRALI
jgi:hypothetical protein